MPGAGSASQQSLGTVVFGAMLASTLLAIPFVPVFYIMVQRVSPRQRAELRETQASEVSSRARLRCWAKVHSWLCRTAIMTALLLDREKCAELKNSWLRF